MTMVKKFSKSRGILWASKANVHRGLNFTTQLTKLWSYPTSLLQLCRWLNPISNSQPHVVFLFWGNKATPQGLHSYMYHPSNSDQICIVDLHGKYFCIFGGLEGFGGLVFYLHMAVSLCYPKHNYLRITYIIMKVTPWCEKCILLRWYRPLSFVH